MQHVVSLLKVSINHLAFSGVVIEFTLEEDCAEVWVFFHVDQCDGLGITHPYTQ